MIQVYLRQAWQMVKQNPLFSCFHIVGTGIAIAMVMVIAIIYYIKIADIYPETNRSRTLIVSSAKYSSSDGRSQSSGSLSYEFVKNCFYPLKGAEAVSAVVQSWEPADYIQPEDSKEQVPVTVKDVDHNFWKVFNYDFVSGKPFTKADFESGIRTVVIAQSLARKLFGGEDAVGRTLSLNFVDYKVCGVVKDGSYALGNSFAQLWKPFTTINGYDRNSGSYTGMYKVYIVTHSKDDFSQITQQVNDYVRRVNLSDKDNVLDLMGQPDVTWKSIFREFSNLPPDFGLIFRQLFLILLILLLVPAINLSGMISSRMEKRLPEMGVRKSFGATRGKLLAQVVWENLMLTCVGGVLGLVLSFILVYASKEWLIQSLEQWSEAIPEGVNVTITPEMLFNPTLFLFAFGICIVINLLSVLIPAYRSLRKNIIYSLNEQK